MAQAGARRKGWRQGGWGFPGGRRRTARSRAAGFAIQTATNRPRRSGVVVAVVVRSFRDMFCDIGKTRRNVTKPLHSAPYRQGCQSLCPWYL